MRRPGRYTLAVMAWIAVFAGWSSVLGLLVAAVTGETLDDGDQVGPTVGLGWTTLGYVLLPLVPTVVALWFNDWLRDGAPSRADRKRAALRAPMADAGATGLADDAAVHRLAPAHDVPPTAPPPATARAVARSEPPAAPTGGVVEPVPLGVPELADAVVGATGFPVAPVLRAGDEAPAARLAVPTSAPRSGPATAAPAPAGDAATQRADPVIDPEDPLGVGDLRLPGVDGRDEALGV